MYAMPRSMKKWFNQRITVVVHLFAGTGFSTKNSYCMRSLHLIINYYWRDEEKTPNAHTSYMALLL